MFYAVGKPLSHLLTHFSIPGATCIPFNAYRWILLNTTGCSELLLRLPSLVPGLLALVLFPVLVKRHFSARTTLLFAFLLALSPFLTFYSRVCRPYSMVSFMAFLSLFAAYRWMVSGRKGAAALYILTATLAAYFHFFALVAVFTPLVVYLFYVFLNRKMGMFPAGEKVTAPLYSCAIVGAIILITLSALTLPAFIDARHQIKGMSQASWITPNTLGGFASMLSGSTNALLTVVFLGLFLIGAAGILRKTILLGGIVTLSFLFYLLAMIISRPYLVDIPLVLSRYSIPLFALSLVFVSLGLDRTWGWLESVAGIAHRPWSPYAGMLLATGILITLFLSGPLPSIYTRLNNFTNHSAYQQTYKAVDWEQSYASQLMPQVPRMRRQNIPEFYLQAAADPKTFSIIEFPMLVGDHFNLYYYYQHFHRKRVIAGYTTDLRETELPPLDDGFVYGDDYVDYVLGRVEEIGQLKFRNMIDVADANAVINSQASFLILHRNLQAEHFQEEYRYPQLVYPPVARLESLYRKRLGAPVFENKHLIVFRIP